MKLKGSKLDWIKKDLLLHSNNFSRWFYRSKHLFNTASLSVEKADKIAGIIKSLLSAGWVIASNKSIKLSTFFIKPSVQWKSPLLQNTPENSVAFLCIIRRYSGGPRLYLEDDAACIWEGTVRSDRWVNVYARLVQPILASRPGVPSYVPVLYLRTCHVPAAAYPARTVPRQTSPFSTPWTADEKMPICMDKIYLLQCILYYLKLSLTWSLAQDSVDD